MTESIFPLNPNNPSCCPKCGEKFSEPIRWIDNKPQFSCPFCGAKIDAKNLIDGVRGIIVNKVKQTLKDTFPKGKGKRIEFEDK